MNYDMTTGLYLICLDLAKILDIYEGSLVHSHYSVRKVLET